MDFISSLYSSVYYKCSTVSMHYFYNRKVKFYKRFVSFIVGFDDKKFNFIKIESQESSENAIIL